MYEKLILNSILKNCNEILWVKNTDLKYTYVSDEFVNAIGERRENILGNTVLTENIFKFEDRIDDSELIKNGTDIEDEELLMYKGTYQMFHVSRSLLKDENGTIIGILGIATADFSSDSAGHAFELVMEDIPYGIIVTNEDGVIVKGNNRLSDYLLVDGEILGRNLSEFGLASDIKKGSNAKINIEEHTLQLFGKEYSFTVQRVPLHDYNGHTEGEVLLLSDMTDEFNKVRRQYNEKFSKALRGAYSEIIELDYDNNVAKCLTNNGHLFDFCDVFKNKDVMDLKDLYSKIRECVYRDDVDVFEKTFKMSYFEHYFKENSSGMLEAELRVLSESKKFRWVRFSVSQIKNSGPNITYLCCVKDIHKEKIAERDSLSTVFNRGSFVKNVETKLSLKPAEGSCAFYMIDIDNFKSINDTYGHNIGDCVIRNVGTMIKSVFKAKAVAGRMGGDEFAVFQENVEHVEDVYAFADKVLEGVRNISDEMNLGENVTVSVGVTIVSSGNTTFDEIYLEADKQLYGSKRKTKNCYTVSKISY